jgi:hypothetical protein
MRPAILAFAIVGCSALGLAQPAFAAASCPGGGTPTNCKAHCTISNPPVCTETCSCAITGARGSGVRTTTVLRTGSGSPGPTRPTPPIANGGSRRH